MALLQHAPVFTFGRRVREEHLLVDPDELRSRGARVIVSDRGGDITFHGPGQIVAYPVLDLRRRGLGPIEYVRRLEDVVIQALHTCGLRGERHSGRPGVWVDGAKIGAIGVRVQGSVTTHGFALNVEPDLAWFNAIVPCGISDASVTSMERLLGRSPGLPSVEEAVIASFADIFDSEFVEVESVRQAGYRAPRRPDGGLGRVPPFVPQPVNVGAQFITPEASRAGAASQGGMNPAATVEINPAAEQRDSDAKP